MLEAPLPEVFAVSEDAAQLAIGSSLGIVRISGLAARADVREFPTDTNAIRSLRFSPDGAKLLSLSENDVLRVFDTARGAQLWSFERPVRAAMFSKNSALLAVGTTSGVGSALVPAATGETIVTFTGHNSSVNHFAFSPDGAKIATSSWDGTSKLWDAKSGRLLAVFRSWLQSPSDLRFSDDGQRLLVGSDRGLKLFHTESYQELSTINPEPYPYPAAFDGDTLVFAVNGRLRQLRARTIAEIDADQR